MNALCSALNFATFLVFVIGVGIASLVSSLLFVPVFATCILMGLCSTGIYQHQNLTAAKFGVAFMLVFVFAGLFFPLIVSTDIILMFVSAVFFMLGAIGLVGAYNNREKWMAW